MTNILNLSL